MRGEPVTPLAPPALPGEVERPLSEIVGELWQNDQDERTFTEAAK